MVRFGFGSMRGGRFKNGFYGLGRPQKTPTNIMYPPTFTTRNLEESREEVLKLYRTISMWIPNLHVNYETFDTPIERMKERVAEEFRKNKHINNHQIADKLRIKAGIAFAEYRVGARTHVQFYNFFRPEDQDNKLEKIDPEMYGMPKEPSKFLEKFMAQPDKIDV